MNSLHPTATDGCEAGLHAFVNGRCRDCGAVQTITQAPKEPKTKPAMFVVTFALDQTTRWRETPEDTVRGMQAVLEVFGRIWTRGPIPAVKVDLVPSAISDFLSDGPVTAGRREPTKESALAHQVDPGTGDGSPVLPAPTPARQGFSTEGGR